MDLFNLPNSLTLLRILLIPVFSYFFMTGQFRWALIVFAVTGFTDVVDGALARWLKKKTTLGAMLDPAADKLLMLVSFLLLSLRHIVPLYLTLLVIGRDLWIISGLFFLKRHKRKLYFQPTKISKANTFFQLATVFFGFLCAMVVFGVKLWVTGWEFAIFRILDVLVVVTAGMTIISGIQYTRIGWMILKRDREYADLPLKKDQAGRQ